jgi:predicted nucleotidyltransferase
MTLTANQIAAVRDVEATWPDATPTLIGAAALGFHLDMSWRTTSDIDLIVALDFDVFPDSLLERDGWIRHPKKSQTFFSPLGCQVDLVPVGPAALAEGVFTWPGDGFVMSVVGLDLAFTHRQARQVLDGDSPSLLCPFLKWSRISTGRTTGNATSTTSHT